MHYLNIILFWVFFGFLSSYLARRKGRNPNTWFWLGILLGIVGVAVIAVLPRPQKRKSRRKNTRKDKPIYIPKPEVIEAPPQMWFYLDKMRISKGPIPLTELKKIWKEEGFGGNSYFWREGMESWKKLSELPELQKDVPTNSL